MSDPVDTLHSQPIPSEPDPDSGLPIGPRLENPGPARLPERRVLEGRYCRLEPLDPARHSVELHAAQSPTDALQRFTYLLEPAPQSEADTRDWAERVAPADDPLFFAVIDKRTGRVEGRQSFLRITPAHQGIEIGNIYWGPAIAGTPVATEANFLFASYAFDELGYRRYEWKCNALNRPSRRAAVRFGFTYEGHFRRAVIARGRSRDTSWYAMIDEEWPALKACYEQWLDPANFDESGRQKTRLSDLTAASLAKLSG